MLPSGAFSPVGTIVNADSREQTDTQLQVMLLLHMDPPEHSRLRNTLQRAFTPRTIRALEPRLRELPTRSSMRHWPRAAVTSSRTWPRMPRLALCELIGIPGEDRAKIFDLSNRLIGLDGPASQNSPEDGGYRVGRDVHLRQSGDRVDGALAPARGRDPGGHHSLFGEPPGGVVTMPFRT